MLSFKANRPDLDVSFHVAGAVHVLYCPHISHPFRRQTGAKRISLMKMAGFLFSIKRSARAVVADFDAATLGHNDSSHERQSGRQASEVEFQHLTQHLAVNVSVESVTLDLYAELVQAGVVFFQQYVAGVRGSPADNTERVGGDESSNARPDLPGAAHRPHLPTNDPAPLPATVPGPGGGKGLGVGVEEDEQDDLMTVILRIVATISVKHVVIVLPTRPLAASCMSCAPACVQEDDASASPRISLSSLQISIVHGDGEFLDVQTTFNSVIMYQLDSCAKRKRHAWSPETARFTASERGGDRGFPASPEYRQHCAETHSVALQPPSYVKAEASKFSFHRAVSPDILPAPPSIDPSFSAAVYRAAATVSVTDGGRYSAVVTAVAQATGATVFSADQTAFIRRVAMPVAHVGEANSADVTIDRASAVVHVGSIVGNVDIGFLRSLSSVSPLRYRYRCMCCWVWLYCSVLSDFACF